MSDEDRMRLAELKHVYTQNGDCWSSEPQDLVVETQNGGGGSYLVITTERWAIDAKDIDKFAELLKSVLEQVEENDLHIDKDK